MMADQNTAWICRVREMLSQGFGVEDIAHHEGCDVGIVRAEVAIYRKQGVLKNVCRKWVLPE